MTVFPPWKIAKCVCTARRQIDIPTIAASTGAICTKCRPRSRNPIFWLTTFHAVRYALHATTYLRSSGRVHVIMTFRRFREVTTEACQCPSDVTGRGGNRVTSTSSRQMRTGERRENKREQEGRSSGLESENSCSSQGSWPDEFPADPKPRQAMDQLLSSPPAPSHNSSTKVHLHMNAASGSSEEQEATSNSSTVWRGCGWKAKDIFGWGLLYLTGSTSRAGFTWSSATSAFTRSSYCVGFTWSTATPIIARSHYCASFTWPTATPFIARSRYCACSTWSTATPFVARSRHRACVAWPTATPCIARCTCFEVLWAIDCYRYPRSVELHISGASSRIRSAASKSNSNQFHEAQQKLP